MRWPWRRFDAMFKRHLFRKAKEQLERMRDMLIAAINANTNYDGENGREAKVERIREIEMSTKDGIEILFAALRGEDDQQSKEDAFETDPLFAPLRRRRLDQQASEEATAIRAHAELLGEQVVPALMPQAGMGRNLLDSML